jgi:hypothetical protein
MVGAEENVEVHEAMAGADDGAAVAEADAHAEEPTPRAPRARSMVETARCSQAQECSRHG